MSSHTSKVARLVVEALRWKGSSVGGAACASSAASGRGGGALRIGGRGGGGPSTPPSPAAASSTATRNSRSVDVPRPAFPQVPPPLAGGSADSCIAWPWLSSSRKSATAMKSSEHFAASPVATTNRREEREEKRTTMSAAPATATAAAPTSTSSPASSVPFQVVGTSIPERENVDEDENGERAEARGKARPRRTRTTTTTPAPPPSSLASAASSVASAASARILSGHPPPSSYRLSCLLVSPETTPTEARELLCLSLAAGAKPDGRHFTLVASRLADAGDAAAVARVARDAELAGLPRAPHWSAAEVRAHAQAGDFRGAWERLTELLEEVRREAKEEQKKRRGTTSSSRSRSSPSSSSSFSSSYTSDAVAAADHGARALVVALGAARHAAAAARVVANLESALGCVGGAGVEGVGGRGDVGFSCSPSAATYGALAGAHADSGDGEAAEAAARSAAVAEAAEVRRRTIARAGGGGGAGGGARGGREVSPSPRRDGEGDSTGPGTRPRRSALVPCPPIPANSVAMRHVLRAWSKAGRPEAAAAALEAAARAEAEAAASASSSTPSPERGRRGAATASAERAPQSPTVVDEGAYADLIAAHGRAGDVDGARRALELAVSNGVSPGPRCYGRLVDAHGSAGDLEGAAAVLREALSSPWSSLSSGHTRRADARGHRLDAQLFASLMRWVAASGDAEMAEETMRLAREALGPALGVGVGGRETEVVRLGGGSRRRKERKSETSSSLSSSPSPLSSPLSRSPSPSPPSPSPPSPSPPSPSPLSSSLFVVGRESHDVVLSKLYVETLFQSWWKEENRRREQSRRKSSPPSSSPSSAAKRKLSGALDAWEQLQSSSQQPLPWSLRLSGTGASPVASPSSKASANGGGAGEETSLAVDLHSLNHWSAQLALVGALRELLHLKAFRPAAPAPLPDLLVVTGRGNRSKDRGTSPVRRAALSLLHRMGCPAALAEGNDGCVVVRGQALAELLERERREGRTFGVEEHAADFVGLET